MYDHRANSKASKSRLGSMLKEARTRQESADWDEMLNLESPKPISKSSRKMANNRYLRPSQYEAVVAYNELHNMYRQSHISNYYPAVKQQPNFPRVQSPLVNSLPVKQSRINHYFPPRKSSDSYLMEQYHSPEQYESQDFYHPSNQQVNDFVPDEYQSYPMSMGIRPVNQQQNQMRSVIPANSRNNHNPSMNQYYQNEFNSQTVGKYCPQNVQSVNFLAQGPLQHFDENKQHRQHSKIRYEKFNPEPRNDVAKLGQHPKTPSNIIKDNVKDEVNDLLTAFKQSEKQGVGDSLIKKEVQKVEKVDEGLLLLIGTVNQVSSWTEMLVNSKANVLYQVIGQLAGIEQGRLEWREKFITILGEENKTLKFVYYETDRVVPLHAKGSYVCCSGKLLKNGRFQLFEIQLLNDDEKNSIARATFFSDRAVRNLIADSTEF